MILFDIVITVDRFVLAAVTITEASRQCENVRQRSENF
jgi:hypothetical protein